jgi:hypothetical protein
MTVDPNACMCGDATAAHLHGDRMGRCTKCACTEYVQFRSTPDQDRQDALQQRLYEAEKKAQEK